VIPKSLPSDAFERRGNDRKRRRPDAVEAGERREVFDECDCLLRHAGIRRTGGHAGIRGFALARTLFCVGAARHVESTNLERQDLRQDPFNLSSIKARPRPQAIHARVPRIPLGKPLRLS
jgi:hypothetical protein